MRRSPETHLLRTLWSLLCACAMLALFSTSALGAAEPHPHVGKLPGFPVMRGVIPPLGSSAAAGAHDRLVKSAFQRPISSGVSASAEPSGFFADCIGEAVSEDNHNACYRGGPVLRGPNVHLIFWQGPSPPASGVEPFPSGYVETIERYFEDVAHDSGAQTNVFAVDSQYGDLSGPGEYKLGAVQAEVLPDAFPENGSSCVDEVLSPEAPCLLDTDIQKEVEKVAKTSTKGLSDIYFVLTPPGVGGCFDDSSSQCAYAQYCAYHGDFGGDGVTPGTQTLYADIPYGAGVEGCDSGVHPNGAGGADAAIDDASHELNETITDPIGSQCETGAKDVSECERNSWTDLIGQEIADMCLPPQSTIAGAYGEPLGEVVSGESASAYNQLINGDRYYTQRAWSNEAGVFEGGCVQRAIGASFTVLANAQATVPVSFDGSASGAPGDPAVYWVWNFEGEQIGTAKPIASYVFSRPGAHVVSLAAYDAYGNAQATSETVSVGAAPVPPPPPPAPLQIAGPAPTQTHFTAAQVAAKLGLPANGRRFAGSASIAVGRAECPPACSVTLRLFARVAASTRGRIASKLVAMGLLHATIVAGKVVVLRVSLNAKGRTMLRKRHTLSCRLLAVVEGKEGGVWQIVRSVILTGGGRSARR